MKDPGCSRRTRAAERRAMRYNVRLSSVDTEPLQHLSFTRIARRDRQGWRKCRPCSTARMQEVGRSTPAGMQAIERRRSQSRRARADESMDGRGRTTQEAKVDESMDGRGRTTQEAKVEQPLSALHAICRLASRWRPGLVQRARLHLVW